MSNEVGKLRPILLRGLAPGLLLACHCGIVHGASTPTLESVQVTATRNAKPASAVPAAISVIEGKDLPVDTLGVNLPEKLSGVPGVSARERQNYAQDVQISIRGFGARSTFGIRGLRLYLDGIPATMPDGQGQVSNFNQASVGRIEVLRGPFSALYGNAAGGVIQQFTADGATAPGSRLAIALGGDNARRESVDVRGVRRAFDYNLAFTHFSTDGFREHSSALRNSFNGKLKLTLPNAGTLTVVGNALDSPEALDPLGLTASQFAENPRQAVTAAKQFNSRKALQHKQLGAVMETAQGQSQSIRLLAYLGSRDVVQFLAIPVGAQNNPLHGGGVVDLGSHFSGLDARWSYQGSFAARPLELLLGLNYDQQDQHRLGFNNFLGSALGVRGLLRRDQQDRVHDFDQYAQAHWSASDRLTVLLGVRHSTVRFKSLDRYVTASNPDDSGEREFSATSPVAGISFKPGKVWNFYASYGQGFETPTFDELGYRPDGSAGLNFDLDAAHSRSGEIGAKAVLDNGTQMEVALFRADTDNELAVATNSGGRSTFQNLGHARRQGLEVSLKTRIGEHWQALAAYTLIDATFLDAFLTCNRSPCAIPQVRVPAGSDIPGVPRSSLFVAASWESERGVQLGITGQFVDSMAVNNAGDARSNAYAVFDADASYEFEGRRGKLRGFARMGNMLARRYAGSVIVNETNRRYFEPAPGRTYLVGLDWRW